MHIDSDLPSRVQAPSLQGGAFRRRFSVSRPAESAGSDLISLRDSVTSETGMSIRTPSHDQIRLVSFLNRQASLPGIPIEWTRQWAFRAGCLLLGLAISLPGCGDSDDPPTDDQVSANSAQDGSAADAEAVTDEKQSDTSKIVEQAVVAIQAKDFGAALDHLNNAVKLDRDCAEAYFQRAGILADAKNYDRQALNDYSRAVELDPNDVRYHNMRGLFLLTRKQFDQAETDFTAAVQVDPKYIQAWNNRGLVKLARGDYQASIDDFNKAVEIDPNYIDGFNNRGFAWYQAGVDDRALEDFNKTLELKPDYVNAINNRGMLYLRMKKFRDAADDFSRAIELDENNVKHYRNRQAVYRELGMQSHADADGRRIAWLLKLGQLNSVIARAPEKPEGYIQRAGHLADGGENEIALANLDKAVEIAPESSAGLIGRAEFWLVQNEFEKAAADATKATDIGFNHHAHSIRGDAFFGLGRFDEAIADYNRAKRLDGQVARAYHKRALARRERGDQQGAAADIEQAQRLDPSIGQE